MRRILSSSLFLSLAFQALAAERATLREPVAGPVDAELISVIDGDTILVEAKPWPQHKVTVLVRIRGIDAPELKAKCESTRRAAARAKERLAELTHGRIRLTNISGDKYFGRVVADVSVDEGGDVGSALLARGLVLAYGGVGGSRSHC